MNTLARAVERGNPLAPNYDHAFAHVAALTGQNPATAIIDVRLIHDTRRDIPALPRRGTLPELWNEITIWNSQGYGAFVNISDMDGNGRELANVNACRIQVIDLDNLSAQQNLERASQWYPPPSFAVHTSPGKTHAYWVTPYHRDFDRFTLIQRKFAQFFDADKRIVDPSRVLRLAGTIHSKPTNPEGQTLVQWQALPGHGYQTPLEALEIALAGVNVIDGAGGRHDLGEASLAAPSLDWLRFALRLLDPNSLDRGDWISATAAIKQAGWTLVAQEQELFDIWSEWCARYNTIGHDGKPRVNDTGENLKQWSSIRQTEVGWPSLQRRVPSLLAYQHLAVPTPQTTATPSTDTVPPMPAPPELDCSGEMLTHLEQQQWFRDCILIGPENRIIGPRGIRYDVGSFNASFGGKKFIIDGTGKSTDEAWKAATRSTLWTVLKVDGTCFRPDLPTGKITGDGLGRTYVNTYVPARIETVSGDPSPFLNHMALVLPNPDDQRILVEFLAHNARYPGHKIPWAPLIQSVEGVGKNVFKQVIRHAIDKQYFYQPKAKQLNDSGQKFNGWMDGKLFFLVDEIKTDDKRDMVETLKPFITETELEIEGKGVNQRMADTPSNWMFFSNHKDAIPITANGRRFAIFYSPIQTVDDLRSRGMDDDYFNRLYAWLGDHQNGGHRTGLRIVANYLMTYPIERGALPTRSPQTTSTAEALIESRGWLETMLAEAVDDQRNGFRAGWISTAAVTSLLRDQRKDVKARTVGEAIRALNYHRIGQAGRGYFRDDPVCPNRRGWLWNINPLANVANYGRDQNYE